MYPTARNVSNENDSFKVSGPAVAAHGSGGGPSGHSTEVLTELAELAAAGTVRIRHSRSYPLTKAAQAQHFSATGHAGGKITLDIN